MVEINDAILGRKGFLNYLKALGGSNIVKIVPSNGMASESQHVEKGLKVVCGANTSYLPNEAWVTEKNRYGGFCQVRVSPHNTVKPNLGGIELAEALSRVIPYVEKGKEARPVLECIRFIHKDGRLTLAGCDGFRLAETSLDFEDEEGEALIEAIELKGLIPALKRAKRVKVGFENGGERLGSKSLVIDTEAIRYKWQSQDGNYPDYEKLIPTDFVADGKVILEAKEDRGKAEIQAEASGEAEIGINAKYLAQGLKSLGGIAELKVKDAKSAMLFSVDDYRLVVMPMVIPESKTVTEAEEESQEEAIAEELVAVA
jgi:DNA polymerase III sliding clamp (beta) subunit (PCNA family)